MVDILITITIVSVVLLFVRKILKFAIHTAIKLAIAVGAAYLIVSLIL